MPKNSNFLKNFPLDVENPINNKPLSESFQVLDAFKTLLEFVPNLKKINCFAGGNNSGKSRLVRSLFKSISNFESNFTFANTEKISNDFLISKLEKILSGFIKHNSDLTKYPFNEKKTKKILENIKPIGKNYQKNKLFWENLDIKNTFSFRPIWHILASESVFRAEYDYNQRIDKTIADEKLINKFENIINDEKESQIAYFNSIISKRLYIPILRGLRTFDKSKTDYYANRTNEDYHIQEVFTGLSMYEDLKNHLLGSHKERKLIKEYEKFLSKSFFDNKPITLIPRAKDNIIYIRIGDAKDRPIHQLGDGVQALIVLTFPLFMRKEEDYAIFIEEPEAHLHPKWQRFFMDILKSKSKKYFPKHQFFITTHSNIFLSDSDASVYRVSTDIYADKTNIEHIVYNKLDVLNELGYKPSDVLLNFLIWVEGGSDFPYIRYFLSQIDANLKEGEHYTLMSYGGATIHGLTKILDIEQLLSSINPNYIFIADSDKKWKNGGLCSDKETQLQELAEKLKDKLWVLEKREIENYVPFELFKEAIRTIHNDLKDLNLTFNDTDADYGDRMAFSLKGIPKPKVGENITLKKSITQKEFNFDTEKGLEDLLNSDDINKMKAFIQHVNNALLAACYFEGNGNKYKIATQVEKLWSLDENIKKYPPLADPELAQKFGEIADKIRASCHMPPSEKPKP